ncbi:hypothetical protein [Bradyrhizobium sp. S69]|uniref:hypothetical protein n=1 Tax=Bradyrhizobium sp. S69 TaxID=1641856 RepID=UPI001FEDEE83|nr:hypothetical protein [Bradyrhizobium sp. S69]
MKDIDRDNACDEANQTGQQHQPPIVLNGKTAKNTEHVIRPWLRLPWIVRLDILPANS